MFFYRQKRRLVETMFFARTHVNRKKPVCLLKSKRKIISGWQCKLTGRRVPIHSNYAPILLVTLALLLQIGPRPSLRLPSLLPGTRLRNQPMHIYPCFLNNILKRSNIHRIHSQTYFLFKISIFLLVLYYFS